MRATIQYIKSQSSHRIAVRVSKRSRLTIVFLGGFRSDMNGIKARAIEAFCREHGFTSVCFDYSGHGSSGGAFENLLLSDWVADAQSVIDQCTEGPVLLVGSSMGAWISLIIAPKLPSVVGFFGIASAPDFTERNIMPALSKQQLKTLNESGVCNISSEYESRGYSISNRFLKDARQFLLLNAPIEFELPVCLVHGQEDKDIPWETSLELMVRLMSLEVQCHLIKSGDHRLSRDQDIKHITNLLAHFCDHILERQ